MTEHLQEPLAYSITEACQLSRVGRTKLYEAIRCQELRAVKHGRRTLILRSDLIAWITAFPEITFSIAKLSRKPSGDIRLRTRTLN